MEKIDDAVSRLRMMIEPGSDWDLSDNDVAAIAKVVAAVERYETDWATLKDQLRRTRDTGFKEKTTYALLLVESIEKGE